LLFVRQMEAGAPHQPSTPPPLSVLT